MLLCCICSKFGCRGFEAACVSTMALFILLHIVPLPPKTFSAVAIPTSLNGILFLLPYLADSSSCKF